MIIIAEVNRTAPDLTECLRLIESTQVCITRFLSLPYGSISLIDLPALRLLTDQIHNHWKSTD